MGLLLIVGEDFFPAIDAGMMRLHVRAPTGTRIEHTELLVDNIERAIRQIVPAGELDSISDNIGLPVSYNLAFYQTDSTGPQDADVLIQLKAHHQPDRDVPGADPARAGARSFPTSPLISRPPISPARC